MSVIYGSPESLHKKESAMTALETKPFTSLTAADLMSSDVVTIPSHLSLRKAAHLLSNANVTGAPVVDSRGVCIGVISATDFVHLADSERCASSRDTKECVCSEWQVVNVENLPLDEVVCFMTPDPVTVRPNCSITDLARMMLDAHIHRVIVIDAQRRPVGVVSSTDIIAAVAYAEPTF
jgi:CBS-domain-containing membrane protein